MPPFLKQRLQAFSCCYYGPDLVATDEPPEIRATRMYRGLFALVFIAFCSPATGWEGDEGRARAWAAIRGELVDFIAAQSKWEKDAWFRRHGLKDDELAGEPAGLPSERFVLPGTVSVSAVVENVADSS